MLGNLITSPIIRQYVVVITVNLSVICLGLGLAWPSPVLVKLQDEENLVLARPVTENEGSWLVAIGFLVGTVGNLLTGYLVNRIGRKICVLLACGPKLISVILFLVASEVWMLLLGRAINGFSDGVLLTVVPMFASEVATKEVRGSLGIILQIASSTGIVIMLAVGPFLSYMALNIMFLCIILVAIIPIFFMPDSPYFLYAKGDIEGCMKVLTFLRGSETLAREEIKQYSSDTSPDEKLDKMAMFRDRIFIKALLLAVIFGIGLQLIGFNAVSYYLQTVLQSTNTSIRPETASAIVGSVQLLASFCTAVVTDRFGRKIILTSTLMLMAVGMFGLGTFFYLQTAGREITGFLNFLPLVSLIIVVFCYSAGCGSLYWMVIAELFEGPTRGTGCSISILVANLFIFLTTYYFAPLTNALGPAATYWLFGGMCVLVTAFIAFCLPETKGKSFAEIQTALGARRSKIEDGIKLEVSRINSMSTSSTSTGNPVRM